VESACGELNLRALFGLLGAIKITNQIKIA
jgi:hypothetical protein